MTAAKPSSSACSRPATQVGVFPPTLETRAHALVFVVLARVVEGQHRTARPAESSAGLARLGLQSREVDRLMRAAHRIHELGDGITSDDRPTDVVIEIVRERDSSLVVLPAVPRPA